MWGRVDPHSYAILTAHVSITQGDQDEQTRGVSPPEDAVAPAGPLLETLGQDLGRYALLAELGRGGMGVVLRAYDPKLQR